MSHKIANAKENLLIQGKKLLLESGYLKLSIRTLTENCGMATGTFYQYYKNKDELVLEIMTNDWLKVIERVKNDMDANMCMHDKIKILFDQLKVFVSNYRFKASGLSGFSHEYEDVRKKNMLMMYEMVAKALQNDIDRGALKISSQVKLNIAAYLLTQFLIAGASDPKIDFEELWSCMNFEITENN